jgi:hypothetical protein
MRETTAPAVSSAASIPLRAMASEGVTRSDDIVVADGLPLERLYARFDAIARGRADGDSSAAHRSVIARLESNQRRAEVLGWTDFVLARAGGSGRLELRGSRPSSRTRELVPDAIPYDLHVRTTISNTAGDSPRGHDGHIGGELANLSWRSRMSWIDDGGR